MNARRETDKASTGQPSGCPRSDYRFIVDLVAPGSRVLDLGCGEGDLLAKQARIDPGQVERRDLMPMVVDRAIGDGVPERIVARPERNPALRCATPEQDRDSGKDAAAVDDRGHCSEPSERSIQAPKNPWFGQ